MVWISELDKENNRITNTVIKFQNLGLDKYHIINVPSVVQHHNGLINRKLLR